VLTWAPMHTFCFFFVREKQALQQKRAEIGRGRNPDGLRWKHLTAQRKVLGASMLVLCGECSLCLETDEAWSFLRQGPAGLVVTGLDGLAYAVFLPATKGHCFANSKLQQL